MKYGNRVLGFAAALAVNWVLASNTAAADVGFSNAETQAIQAFYREQAAQNRGGGRGRGLPPGIARNLERGKPLPPGLAARQLPVELTQALPPAPSGYERALIDGKILLIETATQLIADVLSDAMFQ